MSYDKDFFIESAFGEVYAGTFFADDFPTAPKNEIKRETSAQEAQINEATSKVRMSTEAEVSQQVAGKLNSMYALGGNLTSVNVMSSPTFNGAILSGI